MSTGPVKPRGYFEKLLEMPDDAAHDAENPPTAAADWDDAEFLLPVTPDEFRAVELFIKRRRSRKSLVQ
jgi:hypothetical protein